MNHRTARELADHSGFHMVVNAHPTGYCREHPGHATETEARECFAQYQRDHLVQRGETSWTTCMAK